MSLTRRAIRCIARDDVQQWLPQLSDWLLDGSVYGVQHTWPQLYRNDGHGSFFVICDGDRLLSHCACRTAELRSPQGTRTIGLIGSVATDPEHRGQGLAGEVLRAAVDSLTSTADALLLWAERPELYARAGFRPSAADTCLLLARRPRRDASNVRLADVRDHAALHALHEQKPRYVARSLQTMSTLLTTPGMTTIVLERDGQPVAYACTGKGADLHGHWHELGGSDADLAELLPAAMHACDQIEAALLLPPYRATLRELLQPQTTDALLLPGPMVYGDSEEGGAYWVDGLDSV